jgi:hypothetical protein
MSMQAASNVLNCITVIRKALHSPETGFSLQTLQNPIPHGGLTSLTVRSKMVGTLSFAPLLLTMQVMSKTFPAKGDVMFTYDWKAPQLPTVSGETLWFNERPQFSVVFKDDFRLDTIQYRPNFEQSWTTIASRVNSSVYNTDAIGQSWILTARVLGFHD